MLEDEIPPSRVSLIMHNTKNRHLKILELKKKEYTCDDRETAPQRDQNCGKLGNVESYMGT